MFDTVTATIYERKYVKKKGWFLALQLKFISFSPWIKYQSIDLFYHCNRMNPHSYEFSDYINPPSSLYYVLFSNKLKNLLHEVMQQTGTSFIAAINIYKYTFSIKHSSIPTIKLKWCSFITQANDNFLLCNVLPFVGSCDHIMSFLLTINLIWNGKRC